MDLIFLKLGGAAITDKTRPETPRPHVIRRAAQEIRAAREAKGFRLLLGHGSGSFGHPVAQKYRVHEGIAADGDWTGFVETQAAAARLNRLVTDTMLEMGVPVFPIQASASARCQDGELIHLEVSPIREALAQGLVPLVYGDVAFDEKRGSAIVSTEALFSYLAPILEPSWILLAGDVEGIFSANPKSQPGASILPRLAPKDLSKIESALKKAEVSDVTGGMAEKVRRMARLVEKQPGLRVRFFSALVPGLIQQVLTDPEASIGTLLAAG
ncbi:MAG: isopentenyl phosphate kinase family protein [Chloroflexi bacterium]|nr:isopentenyl phosphate kinase family protein [Chloroflexota bacterium]